MSIAIHARQICSIGVALLKQIRDLVNTLDKPLVVSDSLGELLGNMSDFQHSDLVTFDLKKANLLIDVELMISLGGDGTFLEMAHCTKDYAIPLLGINIGNLGFLTMVSPEKAVSVLTDFFKGSYIVEERVLLALEGGHIAPACALNEVALLKRDISSLLSIEAYINEQFITTYWADGLIIATPTGSTAYSLSCSGPILLPNTSSLVLTPVNPHNLAIRPLVVPDSAKLSFAVRGRHKDMLVAIDGRSLPTLTHQRFMVEKAPFVLRLVQLDHATIFDVLREKFYWGMDQRKL